MFSFQWYGVFVVVNNLLKSLERTGSQNLPESFKPKISRETIREQLNILKNVLSTTPSASQSQTLSNSLTEDRSALASKQENSPSSSR